MKKFFQKSLVFLLVLVISSSSVLQPLSVQAAPVSTSIFCATSQLVTDILAAFGLGAITQAQLDGPWYDPSLCSFQERVFDAPEDQLFGERYTYAQINWITYSLLLQTVGRMETVLDPLNIRSLFAENREIPFEAFASMGPAGVLIGSLSDMVSHPPASGIDSVRSTLARFDPATPAHAQEGYGYTSSSFLRPLWTASRNMAYAIIVVLLIASGFLVMFRVKINPQTAVSLQLMIPRIIITLLLVTFSYAIAGFIIDLAYVLLSVFISLLGTNGISEDAPESIRFFLTPGFDKMFWYYLYFFTTIGFAVLGPILGALFTFIVTLVILFLIFKVWWMMLKTYLTLMFLIIIGPWQIMLGILPNQQGFSSWLRNIVANVSVFVVVPIMFIFNLVFWSNTPAFTQIFINLWDFFGDVPNIVNPTAGGSLPDLPLWGGSGFMFSFTLGYAILSLIPKTADMIKDALKQPAFKYGTAFGEALGPARSMGRGAYKLGYGAADVAQQSYVSNAFAEGTQNSDWRSVAARAAQSMGIFTKTKPPNS